MFIKKTYAPTYMNPIWIVVARNISKAIDHVEDMTDDTLHMDDKNYDSYTFANKDDKGRYRIIIFVKPTSSPGEIAHECKHLVNLIFLDKGVKLSLTNDEHECYYLSHIVEMVYSAIKGYRKKFPLRGPRPFHAKNL